MSSKADLHLTKRQVTKIMVTIRRNMEKGVGSYTLNLAHTCVRQLDIDR